MQALLSCMQNLCNLLKFGDHSDYITTFTVYIGDWPSVKSRWPEIGCVFSVFMDWGTTFCNSITDILSKITKFLSPPHAIFFLRWICTGNPKRVRWARLARSGSQSERTCIASSCPRVLPRYNKFNYWLHSLYVQYLSKVSWQSLEPRSSILDARYSLTSRIEARVEYRDPRNLVRDTWS